MVQITPILTLRIRVVRALWLDAPIAPLWRFRKLLEGSLGARFLDSLVLLLRFFSAARLRPAFRRLLRSPNFGPNCCLKKTFAPFVRSLPLFKLMF